MCLNLYMYGLLIFKKSTKSADFKKATDGFVYNLISVEESTVILIHSFDFNRCYECVNIRVTSFSRCKRDATRNYELSHYECLSIHFMLYILRECTMPPHVGMKWRKKSHKMWTSNFLLMRVQRQQCHVSMLCASLSMRHRKSLREYILHCQFVICFGCSIQMELDDVPMREQECVQDKQSPNTL